MKKLFNLKKFCLITISVFMLLSYTGSALAFWVWTPQTKRWINPKYAAKATAQEQYEYAMSFYENEDFAMAGVEFEKLINSFPGSQLAAEAGYYAGDSYEKNGNYYQAYLMYDKVLSQYPNAKRTAQTVENMYGIGVAFLEGRRRKIMGLEILPSLGTAEKIFISITENVPYSAYGDKAQYKLGEVYKKRGEFEQAVEAFEILIKEYPESSLVAEARYQIALSRLQASLPADYEQATTDKALREFEEFIETSPPPELEEEAQKAVSELKARKAKHEYDIAEFYEISHKYKSALIYYESIVNNYPETEWARLAEAKIDKLKEKVKE